ncbi:MAG: hypothetical protein GX916_01115 [Clostridiales bacterium]|jgi:hypothetical protein|nr:hypothetical protein [Clostridiales bacterium]
MKLGGNIVKPYHTPEEWVNLVKEAGYAAALAPIDHQAAYAHVAYIAARENIPIQ